MTIMHELDKGAINNGNTVQNIHIKKDSGLKDMD